MQFYMDKQGICCIPLFNRSSNRLLSLLEAMTKWLQMPNNDRLLTYASEQLFRAHMLPVALIVDHPIAGTEQDLALAFSSLQCGDEHAKPLLDLLSDEEISMLRRIQRLDAKTIEEEAKINRACADGFFSVCIYSDLLGSKVALNARGVELARGSKSVDLVSFIAKRNDSGGVFTVTAYKNGAYILDRCLCESEVSENELLVLPDPVSVMQ